MKHRLTALITFATVLAMPALASAEPLIYPDIPARISMDDHMAVVVPRTDAAATQQAAAVVVPRDGDAAQAFASADSTYLDSRCPTVLSHPADHTAMLERYCQDARG